MRCTESWKRAEPQISTLLLWVIELLLAGLEQICNGGWVGTRYGAHSSRKWEDPEKPRSCNNRPAPDLHTRALNQGMFSKDEDEKTKAQFQIHFLSPLVLNFIWS